MCAVRGSPIENGSQETNKRAVLTYMMFLMLPSHSAQIFPFLKYPMAQEPQYGPACDKECPPRRLADKEFPKSIEKGGVVPAYAIPHPL